MDQGMTQLELLTDLWHQCLWQKGRDGRVRVLLLFLQQENVQCSQYSPTHLSLFFQGHKNIVSLLHLKKMEKSLRHNSKAGAFSPLSSVLLQMCNAYRLLSPISVGFLRVYAPLLFRATDSKGKKCKVTTIHFSGFECWKTMS